MIRKWSYLSGPAAELSTSSLTRMASLYNFKVFRKTTRFKKFNKGITKMVRKNYARRKHRTNWLVLSYITKSWVLHYLRMRQFERFYSATGRFCITAFSCNVDVFNLKLITIANKDGINILSCSKATLMKHINSSKGANFLINPTKNSNSTMVQALNPKALQQSSEIYPNLVTLDQLLYSYEDMVSFTHPGTNELDLLDLINVGATNNIISSHSSIYSILILLSLFNTQGR